MDMHGEQKLPASREVVFEALNDPEVLKACIPGCQSLEKTSDNTFVATVQAKVGPVKAKFNGEVALSDIDPPNGYHISGEGKGGAAGFAKGGAKVTLTEDGDGTLLTYDVEANVGGKLAQIGSRLIDSTAKKMANDFFSKFAEEVAARESGGDTPAAAAPAATTPEDAGSDSSAEQSPKQESAEPPAPPAPEAVDAAEAAAVATPPEDTQDSKRAAAQAAIDAADEVAGKRKGLSPVVWAIGLVVVAGILIYAFAGGSSGG